MKEAMVTGRMSLSKKEEGNRILKELGTNSSQAINQLYDYVLTHKSLPFDQASNSQESVSSDAWQQASDWEESFPHVVLAPEFSTMSVKEAKGRRLAERGMLDGGEN